MNVIDMVEAPVMAGAVEGADPAVLSAAARADIHLAVWWRALPVGLGWVADMDWDAIDDLEFHTPVAGVEGEIAEGLAEAGYPGDARGAALGADIAGLVRRFAGIFGLDAVKIRLEVIETDACRKFHADQVTARLLTTLVGQGTQWRHAANGPDAPIRQMRPGDVGIFKGRDATDRPAILHRSPPIAGSGETRLLLVIDPAQEMGAPKG